MVRDEALEGLFSSFQGSTFVLMFNLRAMNMDFSGLLSLRYALNHP